MPYNVKITSKEMAVSEKSVWTGIKRGLARRCPNCGEGRLFSGYLKIRTPCEACGTDNSVYPSDDLPPYITVLVVGHVLVPIFMCVDRAYQPSFVLQAVVWLPVAALACLALLPYAKGAAVGVCWANNLIREETAA
jgi:uncharacterized protein (DUF983 family)